MATVRTVLGEIPSDDPRVCLPHERIMTDSSDLFWEPAGDPGAGARPTSRSGTATSLTSGRMSAGITSI